MYSVTSTRTAAQADTSSAAPNGARQVQSADGKTTEKSKGTANSSEDVSSAVSDLNSALDSLNVQREFRVDDSTNDVVVKIIDTNDQKVIRQIPSEEAIKLSKNIREMVGLLYDSTS